MGRKKIHIETIKDDRTRSVTFQKRKQGVMKKCMELSILCGCEVMLVVHNPNNGRMYMYTSVDDHARLIHLLGKKQLNERKTTKDDDEGLGPLQEAHIKDDEKPEEEAQHEIQVAPTPAPQHCPEQDYNSQLLKEKSPTPPIRTTILPPPIQSPTPLRALPLKLRLPQEAQQTVSLPSALGLTNNPLLFQNLTPRTVATVEAINENFKKLAAQNLGLNSQVHRNYVDTSPRSMQEIMDMSPSTKRRRIDIDKLTIAIPEDAGTVKSAPPVVWNPDESQVHPTLVPLNQLMTNPVQHTLRAMIPHCWSPKK